MKFRPGIRVLCSLALFKRAIGLYFYVHDNNHKCYLLTIPAQTYFRVEYESPDTSDTLKSAVTIYTQYSEQESERVKEQIMDRKGSVPYTSTTAGSHWVCISVTSTKDKEPVGAKMRITLRLEMGNSQQEYQNLAKKSHMDDLQLEILKLKDRVMGILRNLDFDQDKMLQFDQAVGSTSKSIMYISIIQITFLTMTSFFQARYLKAFFYKKKLV
uniref:Uncharacterized protein AlNc14C363G11017 n=1 Tax=Albugo laibachii Nc14 TaxID=890382 RepID=F0WXT0_9STRA|nr:conserved hypothetical protein [Albugo laibachii Nc14]|eukprot:CCA26278.1 conserved hypothetical protein [Albugo laibachii Nc14]